MSELEVAPPQKPDWLSGLVTHRDEFAGAAFYSDSTHPPQRDLSFKLVLAISQPQRAILLQCERSLSSVPAVFRQSVGGVPVPAARSDSFQYRALRFVDHLSVPWLTQDDVWVLPEVLFHGSDVHTVGWPEPWAVFTRYHHC